MISEERADQLMGFIGSNVDEEWNAVQELRTLGPRFATKLLERYRAARSWRSRVSCVYHATRYARESEDAVTLGRMALEDSSSKVRYRGCELLAYSLRADVVVDLKAALLRLRGARDREDLLAAIDAIESQNHHFFVDRGHTGKIKLTIE